MSTRTGPKPLPTNFISAVFRGAGYPAEGLAFIRENRLWGLALWPTVINAILLILVLVAAFWWVIPWLDAVEESLRPASNDGIWNSILTGLSYVVSIMMWILVPAVVIVLGSGAVVLVGQAVASPFLDALSEKVVTLVLGTEPEPFTVARTVRAATVAVADIVWTIAFFLAINLPLLLINIVPLIGSVANAVLGFCVAALLLSQEFVGLSMARDLVPYTDRWRVVWNNKGLSLGCGCTTMLIFVIPGLNILLLPLASVGGTLLYCDLKAAGRVDPFLRGDR